MDPGFLDMLQDAGHRDVHAVADRVDIDLDRVAQIAVDQHRGRARHLHRGGDIKVELFGPVDDLHAAAAQHIGRAQQHRIADPLGDLDRFVARAGQAVGGLEQAQPVDQRGEPLAVFGQVDAVGRGAKDRHARRLQPRRKLERRLAAELHDDAEQLAALLFLGDDREDVLLRQRLEIEPVGGFGIGRDRLGVAVDHDRLEPEVAQCEGRVTTAIVEFDPLPDAVGAAAKNDHLAPVGDFGLVLGLAEQRRLVGRVKVRGRGVEFGGAAVDALEHGGYAKLEPRGADLFGGNAPGKCLERIMDDARSARRRFARPAIDLRRAQGELGQAGVGKAQGLEAAEAGRVLRQALLTDLDLGGHDFDKPIEEPGVETGDLVDPLDRKAVAQRLARDQQPVRGWPRQRIGDLVVAGKFQLAHAVEARQARLEPAQRLLQTLGERSPDRHHFADRLHRGRQQGLGALELLERKPRDLGHDIVDRRLE